MAFVVNYASTSHRVNIELLVLQYQRRGKNLSRTILTISRNEKKRQIISPPKIYTPHNIIESLVRILNILNIISKIKSILIIHGVCICIFAYLLKLICNLQIPICGNFVVMVNMHMCRVVKNMTYLMHLWKVIIMLNEVMPCLLVSAFILSTSFLLQFMWCYIFPPFCAFRWWFHCIKWLPNIV